MKRNERIILICLTIVGVILVWRGLWELSEKYFGPELSLIIGIVILSCVGFFSKRELFERI